jgi:hypothetical protein
MKTSLFRHVFIVTFVSVNFYTNLYAQCFEEPVIDNHNTYPSGIATGDFNGDGFMDVAVSAFAYAKDSIFIMAGNGDGTFTVLSRIHHYFIVSPYIVAADFNGDGFSDIAFANGGEDTLYVYISNGTGVFATPQFYVTGYAASPSIVTADFNNDGYIDLAKLGLANDSIYVLLNNGAGSFTISGKYECFYCYFSSAATDVNNDGYQDIVACNNNSSITVLINNGNGTFAQPVNYNTGTSPRYLTVGDFNNDGYNDIATAHYTSSDSISVLMNNGTGAFPTAVHYYTGAASSSLTSADYNGDGFVDLVVTNSSSNLNATVLQNDGTGSFSVSAFYGTLGGNLAPTSILTSDFNNDSYPDVLIGNPFYNKVYVLLNKRPPVNLGADITQCGGTITLDAGNSNMNYLWSNNATAETVNVTVSGDYSVTVTDTSGCIASDTVNVNLDTCAGIKNDYPAHCAIYPNPATEQIEVVMDKEYLLRHKAAGLSFQLTDLTGRIVLENSIDAENNNIYISQLPMGIYHWRIATSGNTLQQGRIVKQ